MKKKNLKSLLMGLTLIGMSACCGGSKDSSCTDGCSDADKTACACVEGKCNTTNTEKAMKFTKKYTNADFYTDGKFNQEVAMQAYKEMFSYYGYFFTHVIEANWWVNDFGLGDFENVGMGGVFFYNDAENGYFAHDIYLLPGQMIPEHAHVKTKYPAKHETWMVLCGWAYNFSEVGEETPNPPALPTHAPVKSKNFTIQKVGDILSLKKVATFHFLKAGDEGAIVNEWATYHDGAGLRFSDPKAKL